MGIVITTCICNRSWAVCISPQATGFGWTPLFNWKGWFFPPFYSWCGAFNPNAHTITNKLRPACAWTGWGLWETQKVILNTHCTNHSSQGEGDPKRRVLQCSLPKLGVDVTPWSKSDPRSLCHCVSGEKAPDNSCICFLYSVRSPWWCTLMMQGQHHQTLNIIMALKHGNIWWEMSGGKLGMLIDFRCMRATLQNEKFNYSGQRDSGQHVTLSPRLSSMTSW